MILTGVLDRFGEGRSTLFHNLDLLMERANRIKSNKAFGQKSLFDSNQLQKLERLELEKVKEWPSAERLRHEKQNLGFYFSGHPLDEVKDLIASKADLDLTKIESASANRLYTVIGILRETKEIQTRTGKKMAFCSLEDYKATIEIVVFPETYEKSQEWLETDRIVAVKGKLDRSRGEAKLLAREIVNPADLKEQQISSVHILLEGNMSEEIDLYQLRDFIFDQPGRCSLFLHIRNAGAQVERVIKASPSIRISADTETIQRMRTYPNVVEVWKE
jgi:DNA polymerase-3 subunit alpha